MLQLKRVETAILSSGNIDRSVKVRALVVTDFAERQRDAFLRQSEDAVASGEMKDREDIRQGLESVPACSAKMLRGNKFGAMLVQVGKDPKQ